MDLGAMLRETRERRGLSLDDLARRTKINPSTLRAIEANDFDHTAHGIFMRGFLRAYAHEVGLDPEEIVRRYRDAFEPVVPSGGSDGRAPAPDVLASGPLDDESSAGGTLLLLAVLVAIAVAGYVVVRQSSSPTAARQSPASAPVATTRDAAPADSTATIVPGRNTTGDGPVATTGATAQASTSPVLNTIRVDLTTTDDCWIAATADGVRVAFEVVPEGNRRTFEAHDELVMRIGQPAAVTYAINGMPGRALGSAAEPVTVRVTPQNYRDYLAH
jgi:cytoskeletal protein RodZ